MDIDLIFKALANPTRRQILEWLKTPEKFLSDRKSTRLNSSHRL